jgi:HSP20 family protein
MADITRRDPLLANLSRWSPFGELNRLTQFLSGSIAPTSLDPQPSPWIIAATSFIPLVDVYEDEHNIVLTAELPGIDQQDLNITVENGVLAIAGERKMENEENKDNFHRIERSYGRFTRSFTLPPTVDPDGVKAEFANGVLKITLSKREEAKPKQVKVEVGKPAVTKPGKAA